MSVFDYVYEPSQFSVYVGWVQRSATTHQNLRTIRHIGTSTISRGMGPEVARQAMGVVTGEKPDDGLRFVPLIPPTA